MEHNVFIVTAILSLLPISELRGAIPYALAKGMPLTIAYPYAVLLNALVGPIVYLFLSTLHKIFQFSNWYNRLFNSLIERARKKVEGKIARFGILGIVLFVAIPLPITGAYTGTLGAWVLGLPPKRTFLAVLAGVIIAGVVVSLIMHFGVEALSFFINSAKA